VHSIHGSQMQCQYRRSALLDLCVMLGLGLLGQICLLYLSCGCQCSICFQLFFGDCASGPGCAVVCEGAMSSSQLPLPNPIAALTALTSSTQYTVIAIVLSWVCTMHFSLNNVNFSHL
jgi:hypothetical protein